MYKKLKKESLEKNIPIIEDETLMFLIDFINNNDIKNVLEIGSAVGYSAINMAGLCDVSIDTIERDEERYKMALKNIEKYNLTKNINIFNIDAFDFKVDKKYDLIFIDAAKSQNINFFERFKNNLSDNGFIITDNLNFHGMLDADYESLSKNVKGLVRKLNLYIKFLEENKDYETKFLNIGDKISISTKK